jgi:hypothetical protein
MIRDALTQLSDGQSCTTGATAYSQYTYDTSNVSPNIDIGNGEPLALVISVGTAAAVSDDAIVFSAISTTSATSPGTSTKELCRRAITGAALAIGTRHVLAIPPGSVDQRYIAARIVTGSGDSVTVDIDLVPMSFIGITKAYADGITWEA